MTGEWWAVLSGIGFGFFQAFNRRGAKDIRLSLSNFILLSVTAATLLGLSVFTEGPGIWQQSTHSYVLFAAAGLVHFFIGWGLMNASQKRVGASRTAVLLAITPLFAALIALVAFGERIHPAGIVGISFILLGVYLVSYV